MMENNPGRQDRLFESKHLVADIKRLVVRGGIMKMASQAAKFLIRVGGLVVMARLVAPKEFGIYAMAVVFTGFITWFRDVGLTNATVQRPEINHRQVSTLFWINAAVGVGFALLTAAMAPVLAWFYAEPRLTWITIWIGISFVFGGLAVQHEALLRRQMRVPELEWIAIVSQISGASVMVVSGWCGAGCWALVLNLLILNAVNMAMVWWYAGWWPGLPRRDTGVRGMLAYGRDLSGYNFVTYFQSNLDNILIGRYWGSEALGFYVKAYGLLTLVWNQIGEPLSDIVVPTLSRLQDNPLRYRGYFLKATKAIVFFGVPIVVFTYVDTREIVLMLLGASWLSVVPIFKALVPATFLKVPNMASSWLFLSSGRTDRKFKSGTAVLGVVIIAYFLGLPWGAVGIAAAYSVAYSIVALPVMLYALKDSPVTLADMGRAIWRPIAVAIICGAATMWIRPLIPGPAVATIDFAIGGIIFFAAYVIGWLIVPGGRTFVKDIAGPFVDWILEFYGRKIHA